MSNQEEDRRGHSGVVQYESPAGEIAGEIWSGQGGVLTPRDTAAFKEAYSRLQGGWCCAPRRDVQRGMPRAAGFHVLNS